MDEAENQLGDDVKQAIRTHARQRILDRYLGREQAKGRFRDPATRT